MFKNVLRLLPLLISLGVSAQTAGWGSVLAPSGAASIAGRSTTDASLPVMTAPVMTAPGMTAPGMTAPGMTAPGAAPSAQDSRLRPAPAPRPQPNQFQRFVQETTGRLLPIYGSELFQQPQAYSADSALPAPADYLLGVGDEVRIQIWGAVDYAGSHVIDRNGQISLPKVGVVSLAGVALPELESVLRARLSRVFVNFALARRWARCAPSRSMWSGRPSNRAPTSCPA
jgi:hypothetical protein